MPRQICKEGIRDGGSRKETLRCNEQAQLVPRVVAGPEARPAEHTAAPVGSTRPAWMDPLQGAHSEQDTRRKTSQMPPCHSQGVSWQVSIETLPHFYSWMEKGASSYAPVLPRGEASPFSPRAAAPGKAERCCVLRRCLRTARNRHGKLPKDVWGHSQNPLVTHDPPCPYFRSSEFTAGRTRNKPGKQKPKEI